MLKPFTDNIFFELIEFIEVPKLNRIHLPTDDEDKTDRYAKCKVIAVGPGAYNWETGGLMPIHAKVGDIVLMEANYISCIKLDDNPATIIYESDARIVGIYE